MTVELLQTLSLVGYILGGVFFAVAIVLFFILKIPKVIGDVSGVTARKAIESIRQQNEETGDKAYKPSSFNVARGKLTDEISPSGNLLQKDAGVGVNVGTEKITKRQMPQTTTSETTVLEKSSGATMVLDSFSGTTSVERIIKGQTTELNGNSKLSVDVEIGFTESAEIIE